MSLDLAGKSGRSHNTTPFVADVTNGLSGVSETTFDAGDLETAGKLLLQVDTSAGDVSVHTTLPTTLLLADGTEVLEDGTEITIIKVTTDVNKLLFIDPITGIIYDYVNRRGESITLVYDLSTGAGRWVAQV